jgi:glycosyltransferase involved in cell wall biosynthesis
MAKKLTVSLVIIARNEKASSEIIFPKIPHKSVDQIYVIDGNSTDGTQAFYKKNKIPVYGQKIKGLGGATFEARKRCKTDAMIFFHPDGNEDPKDISKISAELKKGKSFVIPSRMIKGGYNEEDNQFFKPRKWFNRSMAFFVNLIWNKKNQYGTEIVQGFRGISCDAYDKMKLDKADCTIDFQMVIRALKLGIPIYEFPTKEGERLFGETNFKSIETGFAELKMLTREIFSVSTYPKA